MISCIAASSSLVPSSSSLDPLLLGPLGLQSLEDPLLCRRVLLGVHYLLEGLLTGLSLDLEVAHQG